MNETVQQFTLGRISKTIKTIKTSKVWFFPYSGDIIVEHRWTKLQSILDDGKYFSLEPVYIKKQYESFGAKICRPICIGYL